MKLAWLSNYKNCSGYSQAARDYILALDSIGVDVVPRHINMLSELCDIPNRIKELEKKNLNGVDVVLQHNLPDNFIYKGGVKNVGMFAYEGSNFKETNWQYHLRLMDKIVVFCQSQLFAIKATDESLTHKVEIVPHAIDTKKFDKQYEKIDFNLSDNCFKFYTIAENNRRKNLTTLIATFYSTFSNTDNVALIVKTNGSLESFKRTCETVREGIKRFNNSQRYPKIIAITDNLSENQINGLHQSCDCFVTASHGECFCLPAMDALGFGNPVIVPRHGAFIDYFSYPNLGFLIDGVESLTFGEGNVPDGLYTAEETWFNVNMPMLSEVMRLVVDDKKSLMDQDVCLKRRAYTEFFSYRFVADALKNKLEN